MRSGADLQRAVDINPRLEDDLLERIYVGYSVLKNPGRLKVRRHVADALQQAGIRRRLKASRGRSSNPFEWDDDDVYDRAKKFWQSFCKGLGQMTREVADENQRMLSQSWIDSFCLSREFQKWIKSAALDT